MEKQQYNLFNVDKSEIPNIYFSSDETLYPSADSTDDQYYMNPNIIKSTCTSGYFRDGNRTGISAKGNPDDDKYSSYVNNNPDYNNFIYNYAVGSENMDNIKNDSLKNQLKYLACQIFKSRNKKFDTNNFNINNFLTFNGASISIAVIIVVWAIFSYFWYIMKNKSYFFNIFNVSADATSSWYWRIVWIIVGCIIFGSLVGVAASKNVSTLGTDSSDNIIFLSQSIADASGNETDGSNADTDSKIFKGLLAGIAVIVILFYIAAVSFPNKFDYRLSFGLSAGLVIFLFIFVMTMNPKNKQTATTSGNDYNTGRNIYQEVLNGFKENGKIIYSLTAVSVVVYLVMLYLKTQINPGALGDNIMDVFKGAGYSILGLFVFLMPLLLLFSELYFAILNPIMFGVVFVGLRFIMYTIATGLKRFGGNGDWNKQLLSVMFEFPEEYMKAMFSARSIPAADFPKNNPTGMPWNLLSITIIKILVWVMKVAFKVNTSDTYFNRMLN